VFAFVRFRKLPAPASMPLTPASPCLLNDLLSSSVLLTRFILQPTMSLLLSLNNLLRGLEDLLHLLMLPAAVALLVSFLAACRSFLTFLSQLAGNMAIPIHSRDTRTSPTGLRRLLTAVSLTCTVVSLRNPRFHSLPFITALLPARHTPVLGPTNQVPTLVLLSNLKHTELQVQPLSEVLFLASR
jgi:hypothetical protein